MSAENEKFYLTKQGLGEIRKEYDALLKIKMFKTQSEAPNVLESQDLNPEYISYKEDLELLENRLLELENVIKNVVIIEKHKDKIDLVDLGATVSVDSGGHKEEFTIVGTFEANPDSGRISNESPMGKALLGRRIGDQVSVFKSIYKIKEIKYN